MMKERIVFIDLLIMMFLSCFIILDVFSLFVLNKTFGGLDYLNLGILLFYYATIKSVLGIILFTKNIINKNIAIMSKKQLLLFVPSLMSITYIGHFLFYRLSQGGHIGFERVITAIVLTIGCLALLSYYLFNKTLIIKRYYKIILSILLPVSHLFAYLITWSIILA